jgi:hypothetical protein
MMSMHIFYLLNLGLPPENCKAIFGVGLSAPAATFYSLRPLLSLRHFLTEAFSLTKFLKVAIIPPPSQSHPIPSDIISVQV